MPGNPRNGPPSFLAAMRSPAFYPHAPEAVELVETHISWVLLAGDRAYKVRKPVVFPFLDYGTPARRRHMAEEEVRLGWRLAPRLYLGVRAVVRAGEGWALGDPGDAGAVEHCVEMRRFAEEATLAALVRSGDPSERAVRGVARRVASFHAEAEPAPAGAFGAAAVLRTVDENFETLLDGGRAIAVADLHAAHRFAVAFVHRRYAELEARVAAGLIRECHGDLRAEHVVLGDGGPPQIFDPLEFDAGLRRIDVAADLAFLVMDLEDMGRRDLAGALASEYRVAGGDCGDDALLYFHAAYRAWVRAKVATLRAGELPEGAAREAQLAAARRLARVGRRLAWQTRLPLAVVVAGTAATGKTTLAAALAAESGLPHLGSDVVRKERAGLAPTTRAPQALYARAESLATYGELGARAAAELDRTGGVVIDATFRRREEREAFARAFGDRASPLYIECRAPAEVVAERAGRREAESARVSDATAGVAARQLREFEPLDDVSADRHLVLRTDRPIAELVDAVEAALDRGPAAVSP